MQSDLKQSEGYHASNAACLHQVKQLTVISAYTANHAAEKLMTATQFRYAMSAIVGLMGTFS